MLPLLFRAAYRNPAESTRLRYACIISLLSCYAAGVFLATCLLDLFPEVEQRLGIALDLAELSTNYPLPEFVTVLGFFVILITEQIVLACSNNNPHQPADPQYEPLLGPEQLDREQRQRTSQVRNYSTMDQPTPYIQRTSDNAVGIEDTATASNPNMSAWTGSYDSRDDRSLGRSISSQTRSIIAGEDHHVDPSAHSLMRSLLLLVALSFHSIFEGLAIGLQPNKQDVLGIFVPVILHKSILAFSLGLSLVQSRMSILGAVKSNFIFSFSCPLGIGIGIAVIDLAPDSLTSALVNGILQGFACGTFLYVVFFEILPHEFMVPTVVPDRILKVLFFIIGYATVALLLFLDPEIVVNSRIKT